MGTRNRDGKRQGMEQGMRTGNGTGEMRTVIGPGIKIGTGNREMETGNRRSGRGMGARNRCCIIVVQGVSKKR